jgi:hypothetical protein
VRFGDESRATPAIVEEASAESHEAPAGPAIVEEASAEPAAAVTTGATNEETSAQLPQSVAEPGSEGTAPVSGKLFNHYI